MNNVNNASVPIGMTTPHLFPTASWNTPNDNYILMNAKDRFTTSVAKDLNSGYMSPEVSQIADAVMWPGKKNSPQVQVKTFAVDGIQARDIIFIQRVPAVPDEPNIVLFVPEKEGRSLHSFTTTEEMNAWVKTQANEPKRLESFSQHFAGGESSEKKTRVIDTLIRFRNNDINAIVGPYANEGDNIFGRLDKGPTAPPTAVNGLTNIKEESSSPSGRLLYSGQRPDGETVLFTYDAYGNLLGQDKQHNFYFVKDGLNSHKPLVPITFGEFKYKVQNEAAENVGANDLRGFYEEFLKHLEHPSAGIADALQVFGVNKTTADTVERYLDNPFSALLVDLNTNNQLGKVFGLDKSTLDAELKNVGDFAQGFIPAYGQARMLSSLLAKALRNEALSVQETRDLADGLALKPNSPARKNLPESKPSLKSNSPTSATPATQPIKEPVSAVPGPGPTADEVNRLRPSQWLDISNHAVVEGEQLISGAHANAKGMYQVKGSDGADRWFIRLTDAEDISRIYEIDGRFKLSDGYARIIDPETRKPVMTVHSTQDGAWEPINGPGGIRWPWWSRGSAEQSFDPAAYDYPAQGEASTSRTNEKIDKRMKQDADTFHKKAKTKERPAHSDIPGNASMSEVINTVYQKSLGMIIGEDHSQSAGLRLLIDNAAEFERNNVSTLYSEGFEHSLQPDLDRFFETGEFSPALRSNLRLIDRAHSTHGAYTNRELLLTMRAHGVRVKAIDVPSVEPKSTRLKNMNYYATKLIEHDQAANPQSKWVARVGSDHVFTYDGEPAIRGISQLTGATGVSVDDAIPGKGPSLIQSRDKTELYIDL